LQQRSVEHGERHHTGTNADAQARHGKHNESRVLQQGAEAKANVSQ
jgi:hypothetical protein